MDLKDATSCGRCAGTRGCWRGKGKGASVSLGPDPQVSVSLLLDCSTASGLPVGGWRCSHTVQAEFNAFLSLLTQTQTVSMLAEQEVCLFPTRWTVPM